MECQGNACANTFICHHVICCMVTPDKNHFIAEKEDQDALASQYSRVCLNSISVIVISAFSKDALQMFETEICRLP